MAKKPTVEPSCDVLVLLRHGDAGEPIALPHRDRRRPLTEKGRKQARRAGRALERMGLSPRDVWASRLRRAQETGEVAGEAAGVDGVWLPTVVIASIRLAPRGRSRTSARAPRSTHERRNPDRTVGDTFIDLKIEHGRPLALAQAHPVTRGEPEPRRRGGVHAGARRMGIVRRLQRGGERRTMA